ncbi:PIN domain-containing protein [Nitrosomonas aestuarii]|uniref:PIN domain-containing protein n=1 Tax=Nitrosomonas aestuarii TaxID=52441 RepID=UPI000D42B21F|nr:PIN domain-containing protein [Nitrosomonas aestuarii]PTN10832.1 PIN domain-containing protein [Nitrosomonas aestuarii]
MYQQTIGLDATKIFGENNADHRILNAAISLSEAYPRKKIILVTKDINLRLKAKSLNILSENFQAGKIKDLDALYTGSTGIQGVSKAIVDTIYEHDYCLPEDIGSKESIPNHYLF